jgi:hypothetical protein
VGSREKAFGEQAASGAFWVGRMAMANVEERFIQQPRIFGVY